MSFLEQELSFKHRHVGIPIEALFYSVNACVTHRQGGSRSLAVDSGGSGCALV